jgi:hypothetical protein
MVPLRRQGNGPRTLNPIYCVSKTTSSNSTR